ncbi:MAG: O-antigen ligase family protein [bacterium]
MPRLRLSFLRINKVLLLVTLVCLIFNNQKGSFARHFTLSPFQVMFLVTAVATIIYVISNRHIRDFFCSVSRKIWTAIMLFYLSTLVGWAIAVLFMHMPVTLFTILDLGTFTMGIIIFLLVSFYAKNDETYARLCLYAILVPNAYLVYYFLTNGVVGCWGFSTECVLGSILNPNPLSKTLLVPALFFMSMSLFAVQGKKWKKAAIHVLLASLFAMVVFWSVSRGATISLLFGAMFAGMVFSFHKFTWRKLCMSGAVILVILLLAHFMLPRNTQQAIVTKFEHTGHLPPGSQGKVANVTADDVRRLPNTEARLLVWHFYPRYVVEHPFGIGPNGSHKFTFLDKQGNRIGAVGPDSTYLYAAIWGGFAGLASYLYIVGTAFVELRKKLKKNFDRTSFAVLSILFALSVVLFFDAMLSLYWYYVILALAIRQNGTVLPKPQPVQAHE